jgi:periplasmic protein TonB
MFDGLVESVTVRRRSNTGWGVLISVIAQSLIVGIVILIPLIYTTQTLPKTILANWLVTTPGSLTLLAPVAAPPAHRVQAVVKVKSNAPFLQSNKLLAPRAVPKDIAVPREPESPPDVGALPRGGTFGGLGGVGVEGITAGTPVGAIPPPPPPKSTVPATPARITQGGNVSRASVISQVKPVYPALARQQRIEGDVLLRAIIGRDGHVSDLQVLSGDPLLAQAALEAVKQWRYKPTMLNGMPVEVDTSITVTFRLGG